MEMKKSDWKNLGEGLRLYIPSKTVYAVKGFRYLGIPNLFESMGQISEREARRKLPEMIEAWKKKNLEGGKTIGELVPLFLKYETPKNRRKRTIENHQMIFEEIARFFGDIQLSEFGEEIYFDRIETVVKKEKALEAEQRKLERKGGVPRTTFNYLAVHMNMLTKYAYKRKWVAHQVKIPLTDNKTTRAGRAIDHATAQRLFDHMTDEAKDMYCLSYVNCMRKDEGLKLTWDRFDLKSGLITLRPEDVKTGSRTMRGRQFIVADWVRKRFIARLERQRHLKSPWVFPSPLNPSKNQGSNKTAWNAAKRRAGIEGRLRWHDLRHSGISYLILVCGMDIAKVSEFVGTSVRTLQRVYLHSRPEHTKEVGQAIRLE